MLLLVLKPVAYVLLFLLAWVRWRRYAKTHWVRGLLAGIARGVLGLVVALPLGGLIRAHAGEAGFTVAFYALRFVLWIAASFVVGRAPFSERLVLAAAGTAVNFGLDELIFDQSIYESYDIRIC